MHLTTLFLSALAVSVLAAKRNCGAPKRTKEQKLIAQDFAIQEAEAKAKEAGKVTAAAVNILNVKIYYHVVATSNSASGGYLTQAQLTSQTQVLNKAYADRNVSFTQAGAYWTVNEDWANDRAQLAMKKALRNGTYADMNVYFIKSSAYLGYAYYPTYITSQSDNFYYDGVVLLSSTVPGGTASPYNLGHTLTHESGHWFGLVHTFGDENDGCSGIGDSVADTPKEASPAFGCPTGRDTCPSDPGKAPEQDPITNYMDYSDDICFKAFTLGQGLRIVSYWNTYRAKYQ